MDILNNLGINFKSIIIQAAGFLVLLFILKKYLFGKVSAMINERAEGVKRTYAKIENDRVEAERLKTEYHVKLSDAETEAARKIQTAIVEGQRMSEGIVKRAHEEAELVKLKAQEGIEHERKKALSDIKNQVVTLSILASSKIIQQTINQQTAKKLVDNLINEIEELSVR